MLCPMTVTSKINGLKIPLISRTTFLIFTGSVNDSYWSCYSVSYKLTNKIGFMCSMKLSHCLCCTHLSVWEFLFVWCIKIKENNLQRTIDLCMFWHPVMVGTHTSCSLIVHVCAYNPVIDREVLWNIMSPIDSCIMHQL